MPPSTRAGTEGAGAWGIGRTGERVPRSRVLPERFDAAVMRVLRGRATPPELLPMALSEAAVGVLPVEGAGLSMLTGLRVCRSAPVTSWLVVRAEALQTTLGEGPCLSAAAREEPLVADLVAMAAQ